MMSSGLVSNRQLALLIATLVLLVWVPVLGGPYQFDDFVTPVSDPASQSLDDWLVNLKRTLRPLTKLSYAVEADLGLAGHPPARRFVSLLMHISSCVLLFYLARRLAPARAGLWPAVLVLLWAVHPVHADSVLGLAGRPVVLSNALLFAALLAYLDERRLAAAGLLVLAGLARETAMAGLLVFAVLELSRPVFLWREAGRRSLPLLAALGITGLWLLTTPRYVELLDYSFSARPLMTSFVQQVAAVPVGLWLGLRPDLLSIDYGWELPSSPASILFLGGVGMYIWAAWLVLMARRGNRLLCIAAALWLAALLPTQSVIPKLDPLTNRPLPLALAAFVLAALFLIPFFRAQPWRRLGAAALAGGAVIVLMLGTWQRGRLYSSALLLWEDAAGKSVTNARPHVHYALELKAAGRLDETRAALRRARAIDPFSSRVERLLDQVEREIK